MRYIKGVDSDGWGGGEELGEGEKRIYNQVSRYIIGEEKIYFQ